MATIKKRLASAELTASTATYYTAGTGVTTDITQAVLLNNGAAAVTASVWLVPSGSSAADTNIILKDKALNVGESYVVYEALNAVIEAAGTLQASASSANSVTLVVSGRETT